MSVISLKTKQKYGTLLAGNAFFMPSAFESIATQTLSSNASSITFNSIPSTYQHLQIRGIYQNTTASENIRIRLNGSTTNQYSHILSGNGSTVSANSFTTGSGMITFPMQMPTSYYGGLILDIHDYASTTKNKTIRTFLGSDSNGSGSVGLQSGFWDSTTAVNSVTIYLSGGNMTTGTTFALYGVKGA